MVYTFNREYSSITNYFDVTDRKLISWVDDIGSALILHRLRIPKEWTKQNQNRYKYKDILDINPQKIKEDYIILLHPPKNIDDLWILLGRNPSLLEKNWILIGINSSHSHKGIHYFNKNISISKIDNLTEFLESEKKSILRDRKLDQIFNI